MYVCMGPSLSSRQWRLPGHRPLFPEGSGEPTGAESSESDDLEKSAEKKTENPEVKEKPKVKKKAKKATKKEKKD